MSWSTSSSPSGSSRSVTGQVGRRSMSSGRAMQSSRIDAPEERSATCSIRSRNVSSPHWMSSKTTTSGRSAAACSSVLRNAQAISSADVGASLSPSSERIADRSGLVRRQHVELLQHLDDRPVGDPLAVGEAAAADDRRLDRSQELRGEPRLADAGVADDRDQLAARARPARAPMPPAGSRARAHGRRTAPRVDAPERRAPAAAGRPATGSDLPFSSSGLDRLDLGRVADERERRLPDQHLARLRRLLQPRRHVDRVAGREPLLRPGHDLARHDADPPLQPELGQRVSHLDRRAHRAQRVVLVQHRHPEHGHHGVADELLDAAAVPLDDRLHPLEVARPAALVAAPDRATRPARSNRSRSQNRTVTVLRVSRVRPVSRSGVAQLRQNRAVSGFSCWQKGNACSDSSDARSTEEAGLALVGARGFEPLTSSVSGRCAAGV